jgi:hypothetical protein
LRKLADMEMKCENENMGPWKCYVHHFPVEWDFKLNKMVNGCIIVHAQISRDIEEESFYSCFKQRIL